MKVYEIVSTNKELNEGLKSKIFGGALDAIMNVLGKGSAKQHLDDLSRFVRSNGKLDIDSIRNTRKYGNFVADKLESDPKLVKQIEKIASNKISNATFTKNVAELKAITSKIKTAAGSLLWAIDSAAQLYIGFKGLYEPIATYYSNIEIAEERYLDTGKWTPEEFNTYHRREAGAMVGKLTANIVAFTASRIPGAIVKTVLVRLSKILGKAGNIGPLETIISGMNTAAAAAAIQWINNEHNASIIANLLAKPLIADISANDIAGGAITTVIDAFKGISNQSTSSNISGIPSSDAAIGNNSSTEPNNTASTPVSTQTPAATGSGSPAAYNPDDWEYYTPSLVKNKKTGEINFKQSN
jgi:hypothetical protein